jgi:hypothetical protein
MVRLERRTGEMPGASGIVRFSELEHQELVSATAAIADHGSCAAEESRHGPGEEGLPRRACTHIHVLRTSGLKESIAMGIAIVTLSSRGFSLHQALHLWPIG